MRPATFISLFEAAVANPKFREIALWLKVHRNACDVLPLDWEELTLPHVEIEHNTPRVPKRCYANALALARFDPRYQLYGGCVIRDHNYQQVVNFDINGKYWGTRTCRTVHAFCIINGKIADPTPGLNSDGHYFGKPLDPAQFKDDAELESFLYKCPADYDATFHYDDDVLTRTWRSGMQRRVKRGKRSKQYVTQGWGRSQPAL